LCDPARNPEEVGTMSRSLARRAASAVLVVAVVAMAGVSACAQEPPADARSADTRPTDGRPADARPPERSTSRLGGVHEDELQLAPAIARTLYVRSGGDGPGDGSLERPWADLQSAFSELGPGDRLVLLPGRYEGPYVIDNPCADGTEEAPIEVWGKVGAVLRVRNEAPVLTVKKAYWHLIGLEISPGKKGTAALVISGRSARGVRYDRGHARDGWRDGIIIESGASDVTIAGCHLHHFGHDRFNRDASAITIQPGTRDIIIEHNNIHNMPGEPIRVISPEEAVGSGGGDQLAAAENVVVRDNEIKDNWG
jgi:hypothetical protein